MTAMASGLATQAADQAAAGALAQDAGRGRRDRLRAQVRRLPGDRLRRRRRDLHAVARRQAAGPLLPRARIPGRAATSIDGELVILDERRQRGLRPAPGPHPPGRVAGADARRGDARPASAPSTCSRSATRSCSTSPSPSAAPRSSSSIKGLRRRERGRPRRSRRRLGRAHPPDARAGRGRAVDRRRRGRDRQGARRSLPAGRAQGHVEVQAPAHDRRRDRRLAPGQGGGHRRLADPRPLRRRRPPRRRPHLGPQGQGEARPGRQARARTRPASAAPPTRAAGPPIATSSGSRSAPSWSSRSASTTSPPVASATAPRSCAGATTRPRPTARSTSSTSRQAPPKPGSPPAGPSWLAPAGPGEVRTLRALRGVRRGGSPAGEGWWIAREALGPRAGAARGTVRRGATK